jgi:hypothetical protein
MDTGEHARIFGQAFSPLNPGHGAGRLATKMSNYLEINFNPYLFN